MLSIAPWLVLPFAHLLFPNPSCKCLYDEACWPTKPTFTELESQLSQPLLYPSPPESACYHPELNPTEKCTEATTNANNGRWRSDQPGAMQAPNFQGYIFDNGTISMCYLNTTLGIPCGQGSVPPIGVDARSVEDVQAAVKFASEHRLRLVIKNTGHDLLGRSTARGAFLLWTHHLKNITYDESFVPEGAPSGEKTYKALTLGAGVQWYEAYDAAESHDRFIVGGFSPGGSVGAAGGWIQGGGHSAFANKYGLGVDNVIQFTVVTASGTYLTVNSHQHPDLFWALRGGGGGTYAVVISMTYITHDRLPLTIATFNANLTSPDIAKAVFTESLRMLPGLADAGWGGQALFSGTHLFLIYLAPNVSSADVDAAIGPFVEFARSATSGAVDTSTASYDSFYAWYSVVFQDGPSSGGPSGINFEMSSRFVPRDVAESRPEHVAEVLLAVGGVATVNFVGGGAVSKVHPDAAGIHPSWRRSTALVFATEEWAQDDPVPAIMQAKERLKSKLHTLDGLSSDSATYFNEASLYEEDFQKAFFGNHYGRLRAIKSEYDPQGLFLVPEGVGSEEWDANLQCKRSTIREFFKFSLPF